MDIWYLNGARYYDPILKRFISPDTIVQSPYDPQSLNRYAYCRNNPLIYTDPSGNWRLDNFLKSTLQVASYAAIFVPGLNAYAIPIAMASSMAQAGLSGAHFGDAFTAGIIGGISAGIGQGVAQGIGAIPGLGEGFAGALAQGAGAGFASGGAGAIMSGQSGANAWKAAYQGAAMGAATSVGVYGIQQGIAAYQQRAQARMLGKIATEASSRPYELGEMYAWSIESNFGASFSCMDFSLYNTKYDSVSNIGSQGGGLRGDKPFSGYSTTLLGAGAEFSLRASYTGPTITEYFGFGRWGSINVTFGNVNGMYRPIGFGGSLGVTLPTKIPLNIGYTP